MTAHKNHVENAHQQHPLRVYLIVWGWLFILSACSYLIDYLGLQGYLRWSLILMFMMLKVGLIIAFFMHMKWERGALSWAIMLPVVAVLAFVVLMALESDYTFDTRVDNFGPNTVAFPHK